MKITLTDFLRNYSGTPLQLKLYLLKLKKEGILFYPGNISEITFDNAFEFYLAYSKGAVDKFNAFPLPLSAFSNMKRHNQLISYYYSLYYNCSYPASSYENLKVFKGEKYVWYFR